MYGYRLGIDFGTSNTVAMLAWPDGHVRPLLFDGSPTLPSCVYADPQAGLLVGRDAMHAARISPERYEPNPKRRIDEPSVLLGDREITSIDLIAAVLIRVADEARRVSGGHLDGVTITCPAAWAQTRRGILTAAAERAGLTGPALMAEPVAAAGVFLAIGAASTRSGAAFVVYDLGAGTFDASVVRHGSNGFEVLATEGLPQSGGLDIDAAIVGYLGAVYSGRDAARWDALLHPTTSATRREHRMLWDDVRSAKEILSRTSATMIHIPSFDEDATLTRDQFEHLARPILAATVNATRAAITTAQTQIAGAFLVGGGSRIPLVATMLHQALGVAPTVVEQPELVVAQGALGATSVIGISTPAPGGPVVVDGPSDPIPVSGLPVSASPISASPISASPVSADPMASSPVSSAPVSPAAWASAPAVPSPSPSPAPAVPAPSPFPAAPAPAAGRAAVAPPPAPPVQQPPSSPPGTVYAQPSGRRSNRTVVLVAAAIVVLLAVAGGVGYVITRPSGDSGTNQEQGDPTATDDQPVTADIEQSDVDWSTTAEEYNEHAGKRIAYKCPANGTIGTVWGSGLYTTDSSVCTAAVHDGRISLADGGRVVIEIKSGEDHYDGSEQNGIVTTAYDHYDWSFDFVG